MGRRDEDSEEEKRDNQLKEMKGKGKMKGRVSEKKHGPLSG